ncbi:unnamed protein product [Pieris macdunnoughi]|uniref:tRNA (uracil-O(2)-)-methyltransferase n=2 Tax=Pieris macdunnoughi TaxID=345717 RepID=A0A821XH92_9NEOP|nr:unnamed protein product [Pieris macdunnoughi]
MYIICEAMSKCTVEGFWKSTHILIRKPHVINKRLWGCKILINMEYNTNSYFYQSLEDLKINNSCAVKQFYERLMITLGQLNLKNKLETNLNSTLECLVIELLPKNYDENHAFQFIVMDKEKVTVTFCDITVSDNNQNLCPNFTYCFSFKTNKLILKAFSENSKSISWLKECVFPQFNKWAEEPELDLHKSICIDSLSLISSDKFYDKYNELKIKYGKELVKIWPECTDPSKFVYEDISIATYLLLLWGNTSNTTFVDVGCGNGLLVYILTMEGGIGLGVDIRKRGIWDMYPNNIKLEEKTITPANIKDLSKYEWIIGNHSDELTPWIPVIAAQGYNNKFFLLPCCAFNLNGTKYKRRDSSKSQYGDYLEYIKSLCEDFGFDVKLDRLKIPSTKRICLVSEKRAYQEEEYEKYCCFIQETLNTALRINSNLNFKAREKVEKVRNCTQVDKDILEWIVQCIAKYLIQGCELEKSWSSGKEVEIAEVINLIPENILKNLKSECGGLQTLLRNNHHIFKVIKGKVQLRYPKTIEEVKKTMKHKNKTFKVQVKQCWFYDNHPQGCPLSDDNCSFLHFVK